MLYLGMLGMVILGVVIGYILCLLANNKKMQSKTYIDQILVYYLMLSDEIYLRRFIEFAKTQRAYNFIDAVRRGMGGRVNKLPIQDPETMDKITAVINNQANLRRNRKW